MEEEARKASEAGRILGRIGGRAAAEKLSAKKRSERARAAAHARARSLTPAQRSEIAKMAVEARERRKAALSAV